MIIVYQLDIYFIEINDHQKESEKKRCAFAENARVSTANSTSTQSPSVARG